MANLFQTISFLVVVAVALCNATPARLDKVRTTRNRFLARQEVAEDIPPAQTPYPPSGVRPEVPFTLPTEGKLVAPANHYLPPLTDPAMFYSAPAEVYGPPAETYGPPEINSSGVEDGKSIVPEESEDQPDEVEAQTEAVESGTDEGKVSNDDEEQQENVEDETEEEEATEAEEDNRIPERLVLAKRTGSKAAKLRQQTPLAQKASTAQRFYLINGALYVLS